MKKIVFLIVCSILLIVSGIFTYNFFSLKKVELYIYSYDLNKILSFGKQNVDLVEKNYEKSYMKYLCDDKNEVEMLIKDSDYFVLKKEINEIEYTLLYNDGYYYVCYFDDEYLILKNSLSNYYQGVFPGLIYETENTRLVSCVNVKNKMYYDKYNLEMFNKKFNNLVFIDYFNEEELLSYYEKINKDICYIDYDNKLIYLKVYNFEIEDYSRDYSIKILYSEGGLEIYAEM